MELTIWLAFIAGVVSFISPCVLPLVPAYVGYMGGRVTNRVAVTLGGDGSTPLQQRMNTMTHGLFFVAGFTFVFVTIGLLSTAFIQQIGGANIDRVTSIIGRAGGILIVFFGLHFMGVMPRVFARLRAAERLINDPLFTAIIGLSASALIAWSLTGTLSMWDGTLWHTAPGAAGVAVALIGITWSWLALRGGFTQPGAFWNGTFNRLEIALYSDTRRQMNANGQEGYIGSALMGVVFSAGWTPCIGPVYGAVLTLAASGGDVTEAGIMLTAYSLGLGVPFLLTALLLDQALGVLRRLQRHMHTIELAAGAFLIVMGVSIASGQLQNLSARFAGDFAEFSVGLEDSVIDLVGADKTIEAPAESEPVSQSGEPSHSTSTNTDDLPIGLDVGQRAPEFATSTATGEPIALSDLRGQVVLLNFWATWCGPCRIEMPEFEEQFQQRAADGFTILAVNNSESPDDVSAFGREFNLSFPLALDQNGDIQSMYGIFSYPSTLVLDADGIIVARHFGVLTGDQIDQLIRSALS